VRYIDSLERIAAAHARDQGYDGVVCRHIHRANLREIDGTVYCNTGDWVESCSALVERTNGELQLLRWPHDVCLPRRSEAPLLADAA
jgi:UDP-2,3-diacylglucosamine pyrophosphatase LpxH